MKNLGRELSKIKVHKCWRCGKFVDEVFDCYDVGFIYCMYCSVVLCNGAGDGYCEACYEEVHPPGALKRYRKYQKEPEKWEE